MNVRKHGQNLWQLTQMFFFNSYLVAEHDGLTLIDTGMGKNADDFLEAAEEIGMPIRRIVLTHAHVDHIGAFDVLASQLPEVAVAFSERTGAFLRGNVTLREGEPQTEIRGGFEERETNATRIIEQGDKVGSLRVYAAPGHSPDQVVFLDERDGTLIAGDAFQTAAGIAVSGNMRLLFPFPALATWHAPTALETAIALRKLEPTRLAVGHGAVLDSPLKEMDKAIRRAEDAFHGR